MVATQCAELAGALRLLPRLASVSLSDRQPEDVALLPALRRLRTRVCDVHSARRLALAVPHLTALTHLHFDDRSLRASGHGTLALPGLQTLPVLVELQCIGSIPPQAWLCPHLTSLFCLGEDQRPAPPPAQVALRELRQLHLFGFSGPAACFPLALCQLTNLSSLVWLEPPGCCRVGQGSKQLPPEFFGLSNLQRLAISHMPLSQDALEPLAALTSLTELHLPHCYGEANCLPRGPYLSNLQVLDISSVRLTGGCALPPALASAPSLHTVAVDWGLISASLEDRLGISAALSSVNRLKVLFLAERERSVPLADNFQDLPALLREQVGLVVRNSKGLRFDRQLCSLASELQWTNASHF